MHYHKQHAAGCHCICMFKWTMVPRSSLAVAALQGAYVDPHGDACNLQSVVLETVVSEMIMPAEIKA